MQNLELVLLKIQMVYGKNKDRYTKDNTVYTWYKGLLEIKTLLYKDCFNGIGHQFTKVISGRYVSCNGWYLDKERCINDYNIQNTLCYTWMSTKTKEIKKILHRDCCKEIGKYFTYVISGRYKSCNGLVIVVP